MNTYIESLSSLFFFVYFCICFFFGKNLISFFFFKLVCFISSGVHVVRIVLPRLSFVKSYSSFVGLAFVYDVSAVLLASEICRVLIARCGSFVATVLVTDGKNARTAFSTLCLSSTIACTSNRNWICRYLCSFDSISSIQFFQSLLAT